jgi:putative two-component system response regulator
LIAVGPVSYDHRMILESSLHLSSVLLVDDDQPLRRVVRQWVDALGFRVREAADADQALRALDEEPAGIAVCDVGMPGPSGVWLASRIRELFPDTAVIMATAARDVETAVASLRNQVVDYLLKPFDRARLLEALSLGRDWHNAAVAQEGLQHALQDRLRARRAAVAAALAQVQETPQDALEGLMAILQLHERDGRGHATRVARLSVAIGDELGFDDDSLETLEYGALLHDIGKLDMPASILSKPAPLDDYEWRVMRTHPQVGYDLLRNQPRFADAAEIVLAHHEAYDGSGYPRGLQGTRIPKPARILAVADAYDSMTHPHTQRPPMLPALAVEEIERCSGRQFDPECADVLGAVLMQAMEKETLHAAV